MSFQEDSCPALQQLHNRRPEAIHSSSLFFKAIPLALQYLQGSLLFLRRALSSTCNATWVNKIHLDKDKRCFLLIQGTLVMTNSQLNGMEKTLYNAIIMCSVDINSDSTNGLMVNSTLSQNEGIERTGCSCMCGRKEKLWREKKVHRKWSAGYISPRVTWPAETCHWFSTQAHPLGTNERFPKREHWWRLINGLHPNKWLVFRKVSQTMIRLV